MKTQLWFGGFVLIVALCGYDSKTTPHTPAPAVTIVISPTKVTVPTKNSVLIFQGALRLNVTMLHVLSSRTASTEDGAGCC
jgi:hypothetical protein